MDPSRDITRFGVVALCVVSGSIIWLVGTSLLWEITDRTTLLMSGSVLVALLSSLVGVYWLLDMLRPEEHSLDQIQHAAAHDELTSLYNRSELFKKLGVAIEMARRNKSVVGVLFLDLDRFKNINDSMGHETGDELLRLIGERLRSAVRSTDVVGRFGGDEFVIVCQDLMNTQSVELFTKQILDEFDETFSLNGASQKVSVSIGVTTVDAEDTRTPEDLVRDADLAMFTAKRAKSGFAIFNDGHRQEILARQETEQDLVQAVSEKQFVVVYQPLINIKTSSLYGFEALVRWNHPTKGLVSPGEFLPVAEESGMMNDIGNFVLREACAQAAVWNHLDPDAKDIMMGVNLAEQQLMDQDLPQRVAETLEWAGLEPEQLVLEITENVIVEHLQSLQVLRDLKEMGITLAIDDFGTGQSSLSYVKQFDMISTLKIDQSFVAGLGEDVADQAIVEAVVSMAEALGLRVVVEGVETDAQKRILCEMGVQVMQGFLFSTPLDPPSDDDVGEWLANDAWGMDSNNECVLRALEVSRTLLSKKS